MVKYKKIHRIVYQKKIKYMVKYKKYIVSLTKGIFTIKVITTDRD